MDQFTKEGRKLRPRKTAAQRQPNFEKVEYSRGEFSGEHKPRQFGERRSYGENRGGYGERRSGGYGQNRGGYGDRRESRGGYSSDRGGYRGGESSYGRRPEGERRPYGERGPRQFGERRNFGENRGGYGERRSGGYQDRSPVRPTESTEATATAGPASSANAGISNRPQAGPLPGRDPEPAPETRYSERAHTKASTA